MVSPDLGLLFSQNSKHDLWSFWNFFLFPRRRRSAAHHYNYSKKKKESKKSRRLYIPIRAGFNTWTLPTYMCKSYGLMLLHSLAPAIHHNMASSLYISCKMTLKLGEAPSKIHTLLCFHNHQATRITDELKPWLYCLTTCHGTWCHHSVKITTSGLDVCCCNPSKIFLKLKILFL